MVCAIRLGKKRLCIIYNTYIYIYIYIYMTLLWAILIPLAVLHSMCDLFKNIFIYLPTLGLNCGMWDLLVEAFEIFVAACGI